MVRTGGADRNQETLQIMMTSSGLGINKEPTDYEALFYHNDFKHFLLKSSLQSEEELLKHRYLY
jgi:hypothetical protein